MDTNLKKEWYSILKAEGFNDIDPNDTQMVPRTPNCVISDINELDPAMLLQSIWSTEKHISYEQRKLLQPVFKKESDKILWSMYIHGRTYKDMSYFFSTSITNVFRKVQRLIKSHQKQPKTTENPVFLTKNDEIIWEMRKNNKTFREISLVVGGTRQNVYLKYKRIIDTVSE